MVPHRTPFFLPKLYPSSLLWRMPSEQRSLYLTFDDGPVNGPTDFVLETLAKFGVKGTFFCIGDNVRKHPDVFRKILSSGNIAANHTFNHLNGWKTNIADYLENIRLCDEYLVPGNETGTMKLFRPPYGRITRAQIAALNEYQIVMWDVLSIDYNRSLSPEKCFKNTVKATRQGSVVVFHDSFKAEKNMTYTLPRYIEHFLDLGFSFELIPGKMPENKTRA